MMKDIAPLLKNQNLIPKERAQIIIVDLMEFSKTGKEILSEKDKVSIKTSNAFRNQGEVDIYNKLIKTWEYVTLLQMLTNISFSKAQAALESLRVLWFHIFTSALVTFKLEEALKLIAESNKTIAKDADVYFEIAKAFLNKNKAIEIIELKDEIKLCKLTEDVETLSIFHTIGFTSMYKNLLASQDILKKVSKVLGLDVAYQINEWLGTLQVGAKEHNEKLELALIDFTTGKKAHDEKLRVKDKAFKTRDYVYLDLENLELDKGFFDENIQLFEKLWGKRFWEIFS